MNEDSDDGSDEWGVQELDIDSKLAQSRPNSDKGTSQRNVDDDDDYWTEPSQPHKNEITKLLQPQHTNESEISAGEPMIIVDITQMDSSIHSKFDRNSVNDSSGASKIRKKIEASYEQYAKDASLLSAGTVIPCSSNVWRHALVRLRDERSGHYFVPIFPPTQR